MKRIVSGIILAVIACVGSGLSSRAQDPAPAPGSMLGLSADVSGAVSVTSVSPGGCPTRICSTNIVTYSHCYTNCYWKPVCATNPATGQIQCTNTLVCESRCYTNTFPQVTCTNEFLNPTTVTVRETLSGTIAENPACDQLAGLFPSNAVFTASLYLNLRTNDWLGSHLGSFKIVAGTNVLAYGSLSGVNGAGSHRGLESCAICNHIEGTLRGLVVQSGPLRGARFQATYAGNVTGATCPSPNVPQGAVSLAIDGEAVIPCFPAFSGW